MSDPQSELDVEGIRAGTRKKLDDMKAMSRGEAKGVMSAFARYFEVPALLDALEKVSAERDEAEEEARAKWHRRTERAEARLSEVEEALRDLLTTHTCGLADVHALAARQRAADLIPWSTPMTREQETP